MDAVKRVIFPILDDMDEVYRRKPHDDLKNARRFLELVSNLEKSVLEHLDVIVGSDDGEDLEHEYGISRGVTCLGWARKCRQALRELQTEFEGDEDDVYWVEQIGEFPLTHHSESAIVDLLKLKDDLHALK